MLAAGYWRRRLNESRLFRRVPLGRPSGVGPGLPVDASVVECTRMQTDTKRRGWLACALLVVACSGSGTPNTGSGPCSASAPEPESPCSRPDLVCEYGQDPRPICLVHAHCIRTSANADAGAWRVESRDCGALPDVMCPATVDEAKDKACTPKDAWCTYAGGRRCHCTDCRPGPTQDFCTGMAVWHCEPVPDRGCPPSVPRLGTPCTGNTVCQYGCEWGARSCERGVWVLGSSQCPIAADRSRQP
jgi:hypothetical protein